MAKELALLVAGAIATPVIQLVRIALGNITSSDAAAQTVSLIVSLSLASGAMAVTGEITSVGDLLVNAGAVVAVATVVYKQFQSFWDKPLSFK